MGNMGAQLSRIARLVRHEVMARFRSLLVGASLGVGCLFLVGCGASAKAGASYADASYAPQEEAVYDMAASGEREMNVMAEQSLAPSPSAPAAMDEGGRPGRALGPPQPKLAKKMAGADGNAPPADSDVESPLPRPNGEQPTDQSRKPMLIYRASLGLAVFKVQENLDTIEEMAVESGGYLVARGQNHIKVRVPAPKFEKSVEAIVALGDVHHREISADDVTAEYTDLEIRLKNAISVRARLEKLLDQTKNVEEALEVERELRRLTDEIEGMKGRMKLLQELAAFSTIDVQFSERTTQLKPRVELPFPWLQDMGLEHLLSL